MSFFIRSIFAHLAGDNAVSDPSKVGRHTRERTDSKTHPHRGRGVGKSITINSIPEMEAEQEVKKYDETETRGGWQLITSSVSANFSTSMLPT